MRHCPGEEDLALACPRNSRAPMQNVNKAYTGGQGVLGRDAVDGGHAALLRAT